MRGKNSRRFYGWLFAFFFLVANVAWAESLEPEEIKISEVNVESQAPKSTETYRLKEEVKAGSSSGQSETSEVLMGLLAILGLIILLAWFAKRLNLNGMSMGQAIKVQSMMSLGAKEKLVIVEVEGEKLLLGVTPHNITVLKTLDATDQTDHESVADNNSIFSSESNSFAQQIKKAIAQGKLSEKSKSDS